MEKILGNYLMQGNKDFPVDCETFDYLQTNLALITIIGNIAGDKAILRGCELEQNNTRRKSGYVFLRTAAFPNGEVLYFEGGTVSSGMYLKQEDIAVSAQGYEYPKAYTRRMLAAGVGAENFSWDGFETLKTPRELAAYDAQQDSAIAALAPPPLGIVQMWAGALNKIPANYKLCDGSSLNITEYPELYAVLGMTHGGVAGNNFRLPDLKSRFIVGYSVGDSDYNAIAKIGGAKAVTLTADESGLPSHSHVFRWTSYTNNAGGDSTRIVRGNNNATAASKNTDAAGGTAATKGHENRPPYYTLAFVMRVK